MAQNFIPFGLPASALGVLHDVTNHSVRTQFSRHYELADIKNYSCNLKEFGLMLSDTQVFVALVVALIPGILAFRLATELYK
jgi:photosystem I subunit XII